MVHTSPGLQQAAHYLCGATHNGVKCLPPPPPTPPQCKGKPVAVDIVVV